MSEPVQFAWSDEKRMLLQPGATLYGYVAHYNEKGFERWSQKIAITVSKVDKEPTLVGGYSVHFYHDGKLVRTPIAYCDPLFIMPPRTSPLPSKPRAVSLDGKHDERAHRIARLREDIVSRTGLGRIEATKAALNDLVDTATKDVAQKYELIIQERVQEALKNEQREWMNEYSERFANLKKTVHSTLTSIGVCLEEIADEIHDERDWRCTRDIWKKKQGL
jgi:hypothetical protein